MPLAEVFSLSGPVSWFIWFLVLVIAMYFARVPAHRAIQTIMRGLYKGLRMTATSLNKSAGTMSARNREVLLAAGREATERVIEREFERIDAGVKRDLSECPLLNRRLSEQVTKMEEDHDASKEVPPTPPGWVDAVEKVANIDSKGDPMVAQILEGIHTSLNKAQSQAKEDYRKATEERHQRLKDMIPYWRKAIQNQKEIDSKMTSLLQRTQIIDRHIEQYENILRQTDRAERTLTSSSLVQFFVSFFVLVIATGGAIINFNLIARPMAEMVGGTNFIGGFKVADIAALVIILVEISIGLFLMESLRITRLFPVIGSLADSMRIKMIWITLGILTFLASVEAGLALMRDILLQDELLLSAQLRGATESVSEASGFAWITTAAQMGMGFILPFALTFVAIPLETFVHSTRTVLGICAVGGLRGLSVALRWLGQMFRTIGDLLVDAYDIVIFAPLFVENQIKSHAGDVRKHAREQP